MIYLHGMPVPSLTLDNAARMLLPLLCLSQSSDLLYDVYFSFACVSACVCVFVFVLEYSPLMAEAFKEVTILFADIAGFTTYDRTPPHSPCYSRSHARSTRTHALTRTLSLTFCLSSQYDEWYQT